MNGVLADWQRWRRKRSAYPGQGSLAGLVYCALALGEAGEVQGEVKKAWRDDKLEETLTLTPERRKKILLELGDVLWYLDAMCDELGTSLEEIALLNIEKIDARKANVG